MAFTHGHTKTYCITNFTMQHPCSTMLCEASWLNRRHRMFSCVIHKSSQICYLRWGVISPMWVLSNTNACPYRSCLSSAVSVAVRHSEVHVLQIGPSEEESKKLKAYVEGPDKSIADLSSPEQFLHMIGQVSQMLALHCLCRSSHIMSQVWVVTKQLGSGIAEYGGSSSRGACNRCSTC